jgi:hypothetical protein
VAELKGNEHMKVYWQEEKYKMVTSTRKWKKERRIEAAKKSEEEIENQIGTQRDRDILMMMEQGMFKKIDEHWVPAKAQEFFLIPHWNV